jgi:predicted nuclease of predicted toxin-antitoxin system
MKMYLLVDAQSKEPKVVAYTPDLAKAKIWLELYAFQGIDNIMIVTVDKDMFADLVIDWSK